MTSPVEVEVHLLGVADGVLAFRTVSAGCGTEDPTRVAARLAGLDSVPGAVLHSTSWRHRNAVVVLTYLALPDPEPWHPTFPVPTEGTVRSDDPTWPSPPDLEVAHVVAHGCGHLALLRATDPAIALAADAEPLLWRLIEEHTPAVAGRIAGAAPARGQRQRSPVSRS